MSRTTKYKVFAGLSVIGSVASTAAGVVVGKKVYGIVDDATGDNRVALAVGVSSGVGTKVICNSLVQTPLLVATGVGLKKDLGGLATNLINEPRELAAEEETVQQTNQADNIID
jgi:hypothetical protein